MARADVTVMGAGVFGLSIAYCCALRGARAQVIDPNGPGAGASGGLVGALAPHVPESWNDKKAFQLKALLMGPAFWAGVASRGGIDPGYARLGRLQPVTDAGLDLALARGQSADTLWQGLATWAIVAADDIPGWAPATPSGLLIRDTLSARINPRQAVAALAGAIRVLGGAILTEGLPQGTVVWATGVAGLREVLGADPPPEAGGEKGQAALLALRRPDMPQIYVDSLHIVPQADGTVAIGSTSERHWSDPAATDDQLDTLIARARDAVPALRDAPVVARWARLRPRWTTRSPILGLHPIHKGAFIANGGFKIGFGLAPLVGQVMADLVLTGQADIPVGFQP